MPNFKRKTGAELIADERKEQVEKHGYDAKNDDHYQQNELLMAAIQCVGMVFPDFFNPNVKQGAFWPWPKGTFEPLTRKSDVELLTVAGALIAAEIDRRKRD